MPRGSLPKDATGTRYGKLLAAFPIGMDYGNNYLWIFLCDCGNTHEARLCTIDQRVKRGQVPCCKNCYGEKYGAHSKTHGLSKTAEYNIWQGMRARCYNKNNLNYHNYGGRGITVCDRWRGKDGFLHFLSDMGTKPSRSHSLDRYPNNNGNYEPTNCRWATQKEQAGNTRMNKWHELEGRKMILKRWAQSVGASDSNFGQMLKRKSFEETMQHYRNKMK